MDVFKGLEADSHQRMMFWALKTDVLELRKMAYTCTIRACVRIVTILGFFFFRVVTKKFKLSQYFYWYHFYIKMKLEIIFIEYVEQATNFIFLFYNRLFVE